MPRSPAFGDCATRGLDGLGPDPAECPILVAQESNGRGVAMAREVERVTCLLNGRESPWFVVVYSDDQEEHRVGTPDDAAALAASEGLEQAPSSPRTIKWVRPADADRPQAGSLSQQVSRLSLTWRYRCLVARGSSQGDGGRGGLRRTRAGPRIGPHRGGSESVADEIKRIDGHLPTSGDGMASLVVTFSDGRQEDRRATLLEVGRIATAAGLHLAHSEDIGSFRWAKDSEAWKRPLP